MKWENNAFWKEFCKNYYLFREYEKLKETGGSLEERFDYPEEVEQQIDLWLDMSNEYQKKVHSKINEIYYEKLNFVPELTEDVMFRGRDNGDGIYQVRSRGYFSCLNLRENIIEKLRKDEKVRGRPKDYRFMFGFSLFREEDEDFKNRHGIKDDQCYYYSSYFLWTGDKNTDGRKHWFQDGEVDEKAKTISDEAVQRAIGYDTSSIKSKNGYPYKITGILDPTEEDFTVEAGIELVKETFDAIILQEQYIQAMD